MRFGAKLGTVKFKWNLEKFILLLILILVATPYLFKGYNFFKDWKVESQAEALVKKVKKENQRINDLLQVYNITTLENSSPCYLKTCPYELTVPRNVMSYTLGDLVDKKFGSQVECEEKEDKYQIKSKSNVYYDPTTGKFNIDFDQFAPSSQKSPQPISLPTPRDLFITTLKQKSLVQDVAPMNRCERLNYEEEYSLFEQEVQSIEKMVAENPQDTFVVNFNNTSFNKYLQLKAGE